MKVRVSLLLKFVVIMFIISALPTHWMSGTSRDSMEGIIESSEDNADEMSELALAEASKIRKTALDSNEEIGQKALQHIGEIANASVNFSVITMEEQAAHDLQDSANKTLSRLTLYMEERIGDILTMPLLMQDNETLNASVSMHQALIHDPFDARTANVEADPDIAFLAPVYCSLIRTNSTGSITIAIRNETVHWGAPEIVNDTRDVTLLNGSSDPFENTLFQLFDNISKDPASYKGKVLFAKTDVDAIDGLNRRSNLIAMPLTYGDKTQRFNMGVMRGAIPVFVNGTFDGVIITDINWLPIMKIVNDFHHGDTGYGYLQEITGEIRDVTYGTTAEFAWDHYDSDDINGSWTTLPDGTIVNYGDVRNDAHLGLTLAHPSHDFVGFMDPTNVAGGIPNLVYLGDKQQNHESGIGRYWYQYVDKWTAYGPVDFRNESRVVGLNSWTLGATTPVEEFTRNLVYLSDYVAAEVNETGTDLDATIMNSSAFLNSSFTASSVELDNEVRNNSKDLAHENEHALDLLSNGLAIAMLMVVGVSILFAYTLIKPVRTLRKAVERIEKGDLDTKVEANTGDEIGDLAHSFDRMRISLKESYRDLEGKVEKRTRDLTTSEQRFRDVATSSSDFIWELDKDGRFTFASKGITRTLGYEPEEVLGRTPVDVFVIDEDGRFRARISDLMSRRAPFEDIENWNRHKDGEKVCLLTNGVPITDDDGTFKGYRGVDKDITKRKKTEQELKRKTENLERFSRMAVGRENKMIELKNRIKDLERELSERPVGEEEV